MNQIMRQGNVPRATLLKRLSADSILSSAALALALTACSAPSVPPEVAEPTSALRPEADRGVVPADAQIADYELEARLDAEQHTIDGSVRVTWRNTTSRTVNTLPFHLYMNAFRAEDTAWMASSRGRHRSSTVGEEGTWGYIDIRSVQLMDVTPADNTAPGPIDTGPVVVEDPVERPGTTLAAQELVWSEDEDPSTMTITLPRPVGPGESVSVELDFLTQLPKVVARTGYFEDFHAVAQWYPKIGVLEEEAGWQAHTFTYYDEFYADFGNYQVTLDVPDHMIVGASGIRTDEETIEDERKRLTYRAEMVHDFVWFADPDFVEHYGEHRGIRIRQLIQPERLADADVHLEAQVAALDSYDARFGPYPWSTITIVHPPEGAEGAGGMEYPTLYTTSDRALIPEWIRASILDERMSGITTTVHEFGHQYFQGLFAIREHEEPWLDEGMNTFSNFMAFSDRHGEDAWAIRLFDRTLSLKDGMRLGLGRRATWEPIDQEASDFDGVLGNYGSTVYNKTAAVMTTLRNLVGAEDFDRALATFSEQARFRHPRGDDLEALLRSELDERVNLALEGQPPVELDVQEFLDQALRTNREIDFRVLVVDNRRLMGQSGWSRSASGELEGGEPPANLDVSSDELADEDVEGVVAIRRVGEFVVPVELQVEFADGSLETRIWDGREPTAVFTFPGQRVDLATLDPENKLLLEWQRYDNTAFADELEWQGDGVSGPISTFVEAFVLALLGGIGP